MLAEATTTELSKEQEPQTFNENRDVARSGGEVAGNARRDIENRTGKPVITAKNAVDFSRLLGSVIESAAGNEDDGDNSGSGGDDE
jgi:hypothetical protein